MNVRIVNASKVNARRFRLNYSRTEFSRTTKECVAVEAETSKGQTAKQRRGHEFYPLRQNRAGRRPWQRRTAVCSSGLATVVTGTPPLGSPWDAVQLGAQAWSRALRHSQSAQELAHASTQAQEDETRLEC